MTRVNVLALNLSDVTKHPHFFNILIHLISNAQCSHLNLNRENNNNRNNKECFVKLICSSGFAYFVFNLFKMFKIFVDLISCVMQSFLSHRTVPPSGEDNRLTFKGQVGYCGRLCASLSRSTSFPRSERLEGLTSKGDKHA